MHQFLRGSEAAFLDLEQRARRACIQFQNQEMPVGTSPIVARVGFEVNSRTGEALLLVERGLQYNGGNREIQEWMRTGTKRFPSFGHLRTWLNQVLAPAYEENLHSPHIQSSPEERTIPVRPLVPIRRSEELTHWSTVQDNIPRNSISSIRISSNELFNELKRHVLGQDGALQHLSRRIVRHLARSNATRPATIFMLGPTGVGKTRTAEALAPAIQAANPTGAGYHYLRMDMSEYQERHRISQLLGSPPGYIGHDGGSQLIDTLIANPRTIVLFDEIDKAHKDILQTLMNAIDAGRLSSPRPRSTGSSQGYEVDCKSAIFMFTSNLDATAILQDIETQNASEYPTKIEEICRLHLRTQGIAPELIGRINTFLVFHPLSMETRAQILLLSIVRVAKEYDVEVAYVKPEVILELLGELQSEDFGARPDINLIDDFLGPAFEEAARNYPGVPVTVCNAPFACIPYEHE